MTDANRKMSQDSLEGRSESYYGVLGVSPEAPLDEIRAAYYQLARQMHPDRAPTSNLEYEKWSRVQCAWRCLQDPTKRKLYDIRMGHASGEEEMERLYEMQRKDAERDLENMQEHYRSVVSKEKKVGGVIVDMALYGNLRHKDVRKLALEPRMQGFISKDDLEGPLVDVAVPCQCLVEDHRLILPGSGTASKEDIAGFFNPLPLLHHNGRGENVELGLYVRYIFKGALHEVTVADTDTLMLPLRKHKCMGGKPRGPFSETNADVLATVFGPESYSSSSSSGLDFKGRSQFERRQAGHARECIFGPMMNAWIGGVAEKLGGELWGVSGARLFAALFSVGCCFSYIYLFRYNRDQWLASLRLNPTSFLLGQMREGARKAVVGWWNSLVERVLPSQPSERAKEWLSDVTEVWRRGARDAAEGAKKEFDRFRFAQLRNAVIF
uniref:J domain-containing protein n=1 Tax=Chromera velia CCMP2878 TaxID=1169474 RepID=A0A0G4ICD1_9ALVE|mmetsp:Transcript_5308/g.10513  ORF Transcript_5308/g.10513 Transcript_5308/m.10513 type:complete len:438 (+) Transcript_5308:268-1581(+)|eukprot:Cvel_13114.t1-p1 / transcript=Cvel_13114.t1 / gene=Cvel_13114 / organism=Chromera_velia_CCMP2878 / gene_product=Chaperone protein DnaJ, putative / transcript_product=Chaperone protein DnaJ, putative / location=Cvel_scaffold884:3143-6184(+) / protein_length=437 / sequence_SO=supercontig / SO=protein_coding / is_pseudo=false